MILYSNQYTVLAGGQGVVNLNQNIPLAVERCFTREWIEI